MGPLAPKADPYDTANEQPTMRNSGSSLLLLEIEIARELLVTDLWEIVVAGGGVLRYSSFFQSGVQSLALPSCHEPHLISIIILALVASLQAPLGAGGSRTLIGDGRYSGPAIEPSSLPFS